MNVKVTGFTGESAKGQILRLEVTPDKSCRVPTCEFEEGGDSELTHTFNILEMDCSLGVSIKDDEKSDEGQSPIPLPPKPDEAVTTPVEITLKDGAKISFSVELRMESAESIAEQSSAKELQIAELMKQREKLKKESLQLQKEKEQKAKEAEQSQSAALQRRKPGAGLSGKQTPKPKPSSASSAISTLIRRSKFVGMAVWSLRNIFIFAGVTIALHLKGDELAV